MEAGDKVTKTTREPLALRSYRLAILSWGGITKMSISDGKCECRQVAMGKLCCSHSNHKPVQVAVSLDVPWQDMSQTPVNLVFARPD